MGRGSQHGDREGCLLAVLGDERRRGELLQGSSAMDKEGQAAEGRRWGRAPWLGCWASSFEQVVGKGLQQGSAMGGKRRRLCSLLGAMERGAEVLHVGRRVQGAWSWSFAGAMGGAAAVCHEQRRRKLRVRGEEGRENGLWRLGG